MDEFLKELLGDDLTEETTPEEMKELFEQKYMQKSEHEEALNKEKALKDKYSAEAADYKRRIRESQSEAERKAEEQAEQQKKRDEEFESMKRELAVGKLAKNYMGLGYDETLATEQANAYYDGDTATLLSNEKIFLEGREKAIKSDLMKDMPKPPAGNSKDEGKEDPFLAGWK